MRNAPKQYAPDDQRGGALANNPGATGSDVSGSRGMGDADEDSGSADDYDKGGTTGESGVPGWPNDVGTLAGTDRDQAGPDENMATES